MTGRCVTMTSRPGILTSKSYAGIAGSKEGLPQLPDGEFQPPHPMNVAETWLKERLEKAMPDRKVIHIRTANMTEDKPEQGRSRCQSRSQCNRGCSFGAYFSTQAVTLPAARATNNLTLLSDQVVTSLEYDPKTKRVTGVRTIDANTQAAHTYRSRIVFLCASAMASNQILLNSKLPGSDKSFADSSGTLGRYIMDHPMLTTVFRQPAGRRPCRPDRIWPQARRHLYPALPQSRWPGRRCRLPARLWLSGRRQSRRLQRGRFRRLDEGRACANTGCGRSASMSSANACPISTIPSPCTRPRWTASACRRRCSMSPSATMKRR